MYQSVNVPVDNYQIHILVRAALIKECQPDGLHSINPKYPPMLSKKLGEIRIIGRVIGMMEDGDFASEAEIRDFQAQK